MRTDPATTDETACHRQCSSSDISCQMEEQTRSIAQLHRRRKFQRRKDCNNRCVAAILQGWAHAGWHCSCRAGPTLKEKGPGLDACAWSPSAAGGARLTRIWPRMPAGACGRWATPQPPSGWASQPRGVSAALLGHIDGQAVARVRDRMHSVLHHQVRDRHGVLHEHEATRIWALGICRTVDDARMTTGHHAKADLHLVPFAPGRRARPPGVSEPSQAGASNQLTVQKLYVVHSGRCFVGMTFWRTGKKGNAASSTAASCSGRITTEKNQ